MVRLLTLQRIYIYMFFCAGDLAQAVLQGVPFTRVQASRLNLKRLILLHEKGSVEPQEVQLRPPLSRRLKHSMTCGKFGGELFGHFLRGRSLKGRCNIRVYVPVCSCVCPSSPPLTPPVLWG